MPAVSQSGMNWKQVRQGEAVAAWAVVCTQLHVGPYRDAGSG